MQKSSVSAFQRCMPRWIGRLFGKYPRCIGVFCGGFLFLSVAIAVVLGAFELRLREVGSGHAQVLARMQAIQDDVGDALSLLNASYSSDCTQENLNQLRSLMLRHQYVRAIGLLDKGGRQFCNTSVGLLDRPDAPREGGIDGSIGRYYLKADVNLLNSTFRTTLVERGRFLVAMNGQSVRELYAQYADAVWAGAGAQQRLVFSSGREGLIAAQRLPVSTPRLTVNWRTAMVVVTTIKPGVSPIAVQSLVYPTELFDKGYLTLAAIVVLLLLLAFLSSEAVTQRCRYFQSMDYRILHICTPSNVVCHYQPILDLTSGEVIGCEVLARLLDQGRLIFPDEFIPALNRQELGWIFDRLASRHAIQELGRHLPNQAGFRVALNFFPQNLRHDLISEHLKDAQQGLGPGGLQIELEVTEYAFAPEILPELRRLKADGFAISIDDFGTGYSNLGMVKRMVPDHLKIDRSFVSEMEDSTLRASLIPEILAIAKAVGSQVIAEGIETAAQAQSLQAMGVRFGQGYYFAKPMPLDAFMVYLRSCVVPGGTNELADAGVPVRKLEKATSHVGILKGI